jgi:hypothetical protein
LDIELGTLLLALQQHIDLIGTPLLTFERAMIPELGLLLGKPLLGPTLPPRAPKQIIAMGYGLLLLGLFSCRTYIVYPRLKHMDMA